MKAQPKVDIDVTLQTAEYEGLSRRINKVVSHACEFEKTARVPVYPRSGTIFKSVLDLCFACLRYAECMTPNAAFLCACEEGDGYMSWT